MPDVSRLPIEEIEMWRFVNSALKVAALFIIGAILAVFAVMPTLFGVGVMLAVLLLAGQHLDFMATGPNAWIFWPCWMLVTAGLVWWECRKNPAGKYHFLCIGIAALDLELLTLTTNALGACLTILPYAICVGIKYRYDKPDEFQLSKS